MGVDLLPPALVVGRTGRGVVEDLAVDWGAGTKGEEFKEEEEEEEWEGGGFFF